jgi:hypothetical protein
MVSSENMINLEASLFYCMNKYLLKSALFFAAFSLLAPAVTKAQTKILFDATKAETAGNADWIIDADQHNLGYNTGALLNQGSESNAQQVPTPGQAGVTSATAETYWNGGLSAWGIDCAKKGYTVETLPYNGSITYGVSSNLQDLSRYKVYIVCEPNIPFSSAEKTAILKFVQNGGSLFMISDHDQSDRNGDGWDSPGIWNDLMSTNSIQANPFGLSFDLQDISGIYTNIVAASGDSVIYGTAGTVTKVQWSGGTTMTLNTAQNATVKGVAYKTGSSGNTGVLVAYGRFGSGKFAAMGDSSPCDDGTGDANDVLYNGYTQDAAGNHQKLLMNITIWLAASGGSSGAGISETEKDQALATLWPNPATGYVNISPGRVLNDVSITAYDVLGRSVAVYQNTYMPAGTPTQVSLPAGTVLLRMNAREGAQSFKTTVY